MLKRVFWRLFDSVGVLGAAVGVLLLAAMLGLLTYLVLNETGVAAPPAPAVQGSADRLYPPPSVAGPPVYSAAGPAAAGSPEPSATPLQVVEAATDPAPSPEVPRDVVPPAGAATPGAVLVAAAVATPAPPAVPHPVQGRGQCSQCHSVGGPGVGSSGGAGLPATHQGRGDTGCRACHSAPASPGGSERGQAAETASEPAPAASEATGPAGAEPDPMVIVSAPPSIPHATAGREACTSCHSVGGPGASVSGGTGLPASHQGRVDASCSSCHSGTTQAPTATVAAGPLAATPTAVAAASGAAPQLPHSTAGRTQCTLCHTPGGPGVGGPGGTGLPASHQGRADSTCLSCHGAGASGSGSASSPGATATASPSGSTLKAVKAPGIEHSLEGRSDCTACHRLKGTKEQSIGERMPSNHLGRTNDVCLLCHQPKRR